jgi:DNA-binding response OmpR family regulator
MEPLDHEIAKALADTAPGKGPARILVVAREEVSTPLLAMLEKGRHTCASVDRLDAARSALARKRYDLLLIDPQLPDGDGHDLSRMVQDTAPATKTIVVSPTSTFEAVIMSLRCGATDFIRLPVEAEEFASRIDSALFKSRSDQEREDRIIRLKRVCEALNDARHEVTGQLDALCEDLVCAYRDISDQMGEVAMTTELRTLLRQELDVEDLLRTMLEYLLTKTGPTNAAVFLPDTAQQFGLGAYVNYDCPRDSITELLDHLCQAICPQMQDESEIVSFGDAHEFSEWIGFDEGLLDSSQVIALSCKHEGECLAVLVLFRGMESPFDESLGATLDSIRTIFAEQLAHVIRVFNRAEPQWPQDAVDEDADCQDDYGFGGFAA